ncbi:MAG: hypothetical protein AB8B55_13440 [Mariniblastus sp.]
MTVERGNLTKDKIPYGVFWVTLNYSNVRLWARQILIEQACSH